jgi:hypothetical protein
MPWTFKQYIIANYVLCFGVSLFILIADLVILRRCPEVFYYMTKRMFDIQRTEDKKKLQFYEHEIELPERGGV